MKYNYTERKNLANMIRTSNENDIDVNIPFMLPTFIKVLNSGLPIIVSDLVPIFNNTLYSGLWYYILLVLFLKYIIISDFTNMSISMNSAGNTTLWWEITPTCRDDNAVAKFLKKLPLYDCSSGITFYTFNDKKFPSTWTFLTGGG